MTDKQENYDKQEEKLVVRVWGVTEVAEFLNMAGLPDISTTFRQNKVDGPTIDELWHLRVDHPETYFKFFEELKIRNKVDILKVSALLRDLLSENV